MSEENRPNLNAVGLVVDIVLAISKRIRGKAARAENRLEVANALEDTVIEFVEEVNDILDKLYSEPRAGGN